MAVAEHLVARTRDHDRTLLSPDRAAWLWKRLRGAVPDPLACVLMPDHLHMLAPVGCELQLRRVVTGFTRRYRVRFDVCRPQVAETVAIATRMVRYIFLNPVRAGLVGSPWEWTWSTLRDLAGATYPSWTGLEDVSRSLHRTPTGLVRAVATSADCRESPPRVCTGIVSGTRAIRAAVASVLRIAIEETPRNSGARRLIVQAAFEIGAPSSLSLADELGVSTRTVRRDRADPHPGLESVILCLSDPRLHRTSTTMLAGRRSA